MVDGKLTIFISCSETYKEKVAYPFRQLLEQLNFRAVIVSDAPKLPGAWTPDDKVEGYLRNSEAMLVLCTPDDQLKDGTWQTRPNIVDEMARGRQKEHLQGHVCILKEKSVKMHSNVNPVYDRLEPDNPEPAMRAMLKQLKTWGWAVPDGVISAPLMNVRTLPTKSELIPSHLKIDDPRLAKSYVRKTFRSMSKMDQRTFVRAVLNLVRSDEYWEDRAIASHMLESVAETDPSLISVDALQELAQHGDSLVRSSAAMITFFLARQTPGSVPVDVVENLGRDDDWYVYTPAVNALKQIALTRADGIDVLSDLANDDDTNIRERAAVAFRDLAQFRPAVVPPDAVKRLSRDRDPDIRKAAVEATALIRQVSDAERQNVYTPFGPL